MFVETGTRMEEVYQRAAIWFETDPMFVELSRRIVPGGDKIENINPDIVVRK
jgi:hypothetical protein